MMQMMQGMQDPAFRENIEGRLQELKADPELSGIMAEIETGGPAAMMKCARAPLPPASWRLRLWRGLEGVPLCLHAYLRWISVAWTPHGLPERCRSNQFDRLMLCGKAFSHIRQGGLGSGGQQQPKKQS